MSWLASNFSKFFRGSSGDEVEDNQRHGSAHSTPRLSRARIRDVTPARPHAVQAQKPRNRQHFGSVGEMELHRVQPNPQPNPRLRERSWESERLHSVTQPLSPQAQQALLNRSWDMDRPPPGIQGMDRAWEVERARGMEMLHRSAEKERERRIAQAHNQQIATSQGNPRTSKEAAKASKKHKKKDKKKDNQAMMEQIDNNKLQQEHLERRIDELKRMLLEEKHSNRRDKLAVAKLQQEVARQKSESNIRETLTKEFEREKMLRIETERKLQVVSIEHDTAQSRLHALSTEFHKMEEMVRSLLQFKNKVDQLKQEKITLTINFEKNVQKCRTEIGHLEHENKIVMAELKRLEQQCMNCEECNKDLSYRVSRSNGGGSGGAGGESGGDQTDKVKVLLERLKGLEQEKSQLVLENEKQRHNYEKCLDEIANQVVQALLSQKGLREECGKLQKRVLDLEDQNRQLRDMFHHRLKFSSDSVLQGVCSKSATEPMQSGGAVLGGSTDSITPLSHVSLGSLHSICSTYQETSHTGDDGEPLGQPQPSSPPPWLRDQLTSLPRSGEVSVGTAVAAGGAHGPENGSGVTSPRTSVPSPATPASLDTVLSVSSEAKKTGSGSGNQSRCHLQHGAQSAFHPVTSTNAQGISLAASSVACRSNKAKASAITTMSSTNTTTASTTSAPNYVTYHGPLLPPSTSTAPTSSAPNYVTYHGPLLPPSTSTSASSVASLVTFHGPLPIHMHMSQTSTFVPPWLYPRPTGNESLIGPGATEPQVTIDTYCPTEADYQIINSIQRAKKRFSQGYTSEDEEEKTPVKDSQSNESNVIDSRDKGCKDNSENPTKTSTPKEHKLVRNEGQAVMSSTGTPPRPKPIKLHLTSNSADAASLSKKKSDDISPAQQLLKMSDSFPDRYTLNEKGDDFRKINPKLSDFIDYDSDESTNSKAMSNKISLASTMSLTELLERGLDGIKTPNDETVSVDTFQLFDSDEEFRESDKGTNDNQNGSGPRTAKFNNGKYFVNMHKDERSEVDYGDYVCLRKIREYVYVNMPELMGSGQGGRATANAPGELSPELEEICECGSCDRLYQEKRQQSSGIKVAACSSNGSSNTLPRMASPHRPKHLHLSPNRSRQGSTALSPSHQYAHAYSSSEQSRNSTPNHVHLRSHSYSYGGEYPNSPLSVAREPESDYVNITPVQYQKIFSPSTQNPSSSYSAPIQYSGSQSSTFSSAPTNTYAKSHHQQLPVSNQTPTKTPPPTKPKPRMSVGEKRGNGEVGSVDRLGSDTEGPSNPSSCCSPDSAMQKSYTSSDSTETHERPTGRTLERLREARDEGYSSNSANSIKAEADALRNQSESSTPTNVYNGQPARQNSQGSVHVEAQIHAHYEKQAGSLTSLHSLTSVESECGAKVKDLRDYVKKHLTTNEGCSQQVSNSSQQPLSSASVRLTSLGAYISASQSNCSPGNVLRASRSAQQITSSTVTYCIRAHRIRRTHSTSCCLRSRTLAEFHSFLLKRCFSDCNVEKTVLCLKAMHLAKQRTASQSPVKQTPVPQQTQPNVSGPYKPMYQIGYDQQRTPTAVAKAQPIYVNTAELHYAIRQQQVQQQQQHQQQQQQQQQQQLLTQYSVQTQGQMRGQNHGYTQSQWQSQTQGQLQGYTQGQIQGQTQGARRNATANAQGSRPPVGGQQVSSSYAQQVSPMYGRGFDKWEERRVEGSERGYQSWDEMNPAEGTVTSRYEEIRHPKLLDVRTEHKNQIFFNVIESQHTPATFRGSSQKQLSLISDATYFDATQPKDNRIISPHHNEPCNVSKVPEVWKQQAYDSVPSLCDPCTSENSACSSIEDVNKSELHDRTQKHIASKGCKKTRCNVSSDASQNSSSLIKDLGEPSAQLFFYNRTPDLDNTKTNTENTRKHELTESSTNINFCTQNESSYRKSKDIHSDRVQNNVSMGTDCKSSRSEEENESNQQRNVLDELTKAIDEMQASLALLDINPTCEKVKGDEESKVSQRFAAEGRSNHYATRSEGGSGRNDGRVKQSEVANGSKTGEDGEMRRCVGSGFLDSLVLLSSSSEEDSTAAPAWHLFLDRLEDAGALTSSERAERKPFSALDISPSPPDKSVDLSQMYKRQSSVTSHPHDNQPSTVSEKDFSTDQYTPIRASGSNDASDISGKGGRAEKKPLEEGGKVCGDSGGSETGSPSSVDSWASGCECDVEQCPHARHYDTTTGRTSTHGVGERVSQEPAMFSATNADMYGDASAASYTSSSHTDHSDASVSYFFEPPIHPRVYELREDHRLEQDCQVRRVSNAVFYPNPGQDYPEYKTDTGVSSSKDYYPEVDWAAHDEKSDQSPFQETSHKGGVYDAEHQTDCSTSSYAFRDEVLLAEDSVYMSCISEVRHPNSRATTNNPGDEVFCDAPSTQQPHYASNKQCGQMPVEDVEWEVREREVESGESPGRSRTCALRLGGRTKSFDSDNTSVGIDGFSLSDSCCESDPDEQDL